MVGHFIYISVTRQAQLFISITFTPHTYTIEKNLGNPTLAVVGCTLYYELQHFSLRFDLTLNYKFTVLRRIIQNNKCLTSVLNGC